LATNLIRTALPPHNSGDSSIMTKNQAINLIDGYQQALEDFAIAPLITRLKTYSDGDFDVAWMNLTESELESLAALFIRQLTANLKGKAIAGYLNALRHGSTILPPSLVHLTFPPPSIDLPANYPNVQTPRYLYGDKLRWIADSDKTDWGIVIGRFYSFAPHHCCWTWCYLIWLDTSHFQTANAHLVAPCALPLSSSKYLNRAQTSVRVPL